MYMYNGKTEPEGNTIVNKISNYPRNEVWRSKTTASQIEQAGERLFSTCTGV